MKRLLLIVLLIVALGAALVWGFMKGRSESAGEAESERPIKTPIRVSTVRGAPVITLDAKMREKSGIETAVPTPAEYRQQLRAYGTVLDLGRLTDLRNSYATAQAQLQTVRAKLAASKTAFERAQKLYKDEQNVSLAQLQTAEAAFRTDEANLSAAESQARTLAATAQQEWGPVLGKALVAGAPMLVRLIERREMLLQVTLPPGLAIPRLPSRAAIQTNRDSRAPISFISAAPRTDPKIQGLSFFYTARADSGVLPGMSVLAYLPAGAAVTGVRVPAEAIVWWKDRAWIYRRVGPETFTRVQISTDQPAPEGGYVIGDFPPASEIVTRGAQLLLSEEFRAQIQVGD